MSTKIVKGRLVTVDNAERKLAFIFKLHCYSSRK